MTDTARTRRDGITCAVLLGALVLLAVLTPSTPASALRLLLVVVVLGCGPGWGLVAFRSPAHTGLAWVMAVSASLALSMLTSLGLLYTHHFHPMWGFWGLMVATAVLLAAHVVRWRRGRRA